MQLQGARARSTRGLVLQQLARSLSLDFWYNENFMDSGLKELAKMIPAACTSLSLDFRCTYDQIDSHGNREVDEISRTVASLAAARRTVVP